MRVHGTVAPLSWCAIASHCPLAPVRMQADIRIARPSFVKKRTTKLLACEIVLFSIRSYRTGNVHME